MVVYGYQGAASEHEKFALTGALIDAALGELAAASRGQPSLIVGDLKVEPSKIWLFVWFLRGLGFCFWSCTWSHLQPHFCTDWRALVGVS